MRLFPHRLAQEEDDDLNDILEDFYMDQYSYVPMAAPTKRIAVMQGLSKLKIPYEYAAWTPGFTIFRIKNDQLDKLSEGPYGKCLLGLESYPFRKYDDHKNRTVFRKNLQWNRNNPS